MTSVASEDEALTGLDETVQGYCALFACRDCVDCEFRTGVDVAADEDVGFGSLVGEAVRFRGVVAVEFDLAAFEQVAPDDGLTYRDEHAVCVRLGHDVFVVNGGELSVRIEHGHALYELDARCFAFLLDNAFGSHGIDDLDALLFRLRDFLFECGHFVALFEAVKRHFVRAVCRRERPRGQMKKHPLFESAFALPKAFYALLMTSFSLRSTRCFSSILMTLTSTMSPTLTTSVTLSTLSLESLEM